MLTLIPVGALLIDTALPYFLSQAIGFIATSDFNEVKPALITAGLVGLLGALFNLVGFRTMVWHESNIRSELSSSTFADIIRKDSSFFANTKVGALTTRYIDFIRSEVTIQDLLIIRTLGFILSVGAGLIILFQQSWLISLVVVAFIVTLIIQIRWSIKKRTPWRYEKRKIVGELHGAVADNVSNNTVVKTFAKESFEINRINAIAQQYSNAFYKDVSFVVTEASVRVGLMVLIQIVTVVLSIYAIQAGTLSIATAVFVLAYMQRIGSQLFVLGDILNGYDQALLDASPMSEMLSVESAVTDMPDARPLSIADPSVHFADVSYRYEVDADDVLCNINLSIPAGQKVGLVGHSGAGKTTVTHLLLRFDNPTNGKVLIDRHDIQTITQQSLRESIAFVPQEPMLFHRSLRENIAYGNTNASDDDIIAAARRANAWEFIEHMPDQLDTIVGERGVKLSGGQRQRIAIARAILKDAPILVLDEATSALDSESEKLIQQSLETLMKDRTSIVIAHRLSTIAKLDRIIVLDDGKIIEDGTHAELLAKKGTYAKLWKHQSGGFIED